MRLIDADELRKKLSTVCPLYARDEYDYGTKDVLDKVDDLIKEQPMAYDMDKAVEQMEEHKKSITGRRERDILDAAGKTGAKAAVERDIEIVKSGGNWGWNL